MTQHTYSKVNEEIEKRADSLMECNLNLQADTLSWRRWSYQRKLIMQLSKVEVLSPTASVPVNIDQ